MVDILPQVKYLHISRFFPLINLLPFFQPITKGKFISSFAICDLQMLKDAHSSRLFYRKLSQSQSAGDTNSVKFFLFTCKRFTSKLNKSHLKS